MTRTLDGIVAKGPALERSAHHRGGHGHLPARRRPERPGRAERDLSRRRDGVTPVTDRREAAGLRAAGRGRRPAGVLVVDDSPVFRTGMSRAVQACEGLELLAEADDGAAALAAIADLDPDLVILDLRMPNLDGFGVLDALRAQDPPPSCRVLVISATLEDGVEADARAAGADEVLSKALTRSDICAAALRLLAD